MFFFKFEELAGNLAQNSEIHKALRRFYKACDGFEQRESRLNVAEFKKYLQFHPLATQMGYFYENIEKGCTMQHMGDRELLNKIGRSSVGDAEEFVYITNELSDEIEKGRIKPIRGKPQNIYALYP